ncbi:small integral membrane protein 15 [Procambarus clarkii]|uniref:small integral membrane protein 15 n=1 Tax=Procambarus clarkii TaxID=6728 RepID=UPI001E676948|nr:small integral membrane protein 15-like [Procambarus clarkii]XP_045609382.1 small integral membrane protein 15-like [Procambarus clarkii]XP_045609383.1 small integral membrane protein 15-like [Procambarus clarkii]
MDGDDAIKTPIEEVSGGWLHQLVVYAARNPWEFCWYLLLCLSPMFFISAILSWKLAKALEAQEKALVMRRTYSSVLLQQHAATITLPEGTEGKMHHITSESKKNN